MCDANAEIERIKQQLGLQPHPGCNGYFVEVFRADRQVNFVIPTKHDGPRAAGTSIYFLLERPNFTPWHRHLSEEAFYWHIGGPLKVHTISQDGAYKMYRLGNLLKEQGTDCVCQVVVPHDTWYALELDESAPYCLYSAVLMPGFEFRDWLDGNRQEMIKMFPQHKAIIERLSIST